MSSQLRGVERQLKQVKQATDTYRDSNGKLRDSYGRFVGGADKSTAALGKQKAAITALGTASKGAIGMLGRLAKAMSVGALGVGVLGVGAAGYLGYSSLNKAMDFEAQMSSIKALTGASAAEMQKMQALALEQGAKTKYNALEAAQGIEELLKAGITPAQVQAGALNAALNLATAGGLGLAEAAEIMSTSLNAYKKDALTAAQASDILAGTANASATDVHDLRYSLAAVGAVADGVGMSFKDTNTALGVFANNGLKGSDAGTSLKTMLLNLSPASETAAAMMEKLGIDTAKSGNAFYDAHGDLKALDEIANVLQKSLKGLNAQQRQDALRDMFGTDAIRAANILYKEGAAGVKEFYGEMLKVTALDVAKQKMDNAAGAVEQFKGAWETLQISAMLPTLPIVKELALAAADFIEKYSPAITKAMEDAVDGARKYVSTNFTNNPEFKKLPTLEAKIKFAFGKVGDAFNGWWNGGGSAAFSSVISQIVAFTVNGLEAAIPQLVNVGLKVGRGIGEGIMSGIRSSISFDNLINADSIANLKYNAQYSAASKLKDSAAKNSATNPGKPLISGGTISAPAEKSWDEKAWDSVKNAGSNVRKFVTGYSGGLERVPYHRFPAILHKDEMVLNATEARKYRGGGGGSSGGGIVINMHGTVIREDADVERLASALAHKLAM